MLISVRWLPGHSCIAGGTFSMIDETQFNPMFHERVAPGTLQPTPKPPLRAPRARKPAGRGRA
jgi:hypothetical protein